MIAYSYPLRQIQLRELFLLRININIRLVGIELKKQKLSYFLFVWFQTDLNALAIKLFRDNTKKSRPSLVEFL